VRQRPGTRSSSPPTSSAVLRQPYGVALCPQVNAAFSNGARLIRVEVIDCAYGAVTTAAASRAATTAHTDHVVC